MILPHRKKAVGSKFSTATHIIYNLGQLGLSIEDSKQMSFNTYLNVCGLSAYLCDSIKNNKKEATQEDIDKLLG